MKAASLRALDIARSLIWNGMKSFDAFFFLFFVLAHAVPGVAVHHVGVLARQIKVIGHNHF